MKKAIFLSTAILSGCTLTNNAVEKNVQAESKLQFDVPHNIKHAGKNYKLQADHDLGTIARFVYFSGKESPSHWKSEIELLHDHNIENRNLKQRVELRERVYKKTDVEHFSFTEKNNALYSFVIYPPTKTQKNWQVNIARGEDVSGCGFIQYQYILKVAKTQKLANMGKIKLIAYLKKYVIDKEMSRLEKLHWKWQCKVSENQIKSKN